MLPPTASIRSNPAFLLAGPRQPGVHPHQCRPVSAESLRPLGTFVFCMLWKAEKAGEAERVLRRPSLVTSSFVFFSWTQLSVVFLFDFCWWAFVIINTRTLCAAIVAHKCGVRVAFDSSWFLLSGTVTMSEIKSMRLLGEQKSTSCHLIPIRGIEPRAAAIKGMKGGNVSRYTISDWVIPISDE